MDNEAKGWLCLAAIVGLVIVSITAICYHSTNKAFELGYVQIQKAGTTETYWTKK